MMILCNNFRPSSTADASTRCMFLLHSALSPPGGVLSPNPQTCPGAPLTSAVSHPPTMSPANPLRGKKCRLPPVSRSHTHPTSRPSRPTPPPRPPAARCIGANLSVVAALSYIQRGRPRGGLGNHLQPSPPLHVYPAFCSQSLFSKHPPPPPPDEQKQHCGSLAGWVDATLTLTLTNTLTLTLTLSNTARGSCRFEGVVTPASSLRDQIHLDVSMIANRVSNLCRETLNGHRRHKVRGAG